MNYYKLKIIKKQLNVITFIRYKSIYNCKYLLDEYCKEKDIKTISSSTIGRVIKDKNLFFYSKDYNHYGKEKRVDNKKKNRIKNYKPIKPGDLIQVDSIIFFMNGIKRYIITAIDTKLFLVIFQLT